MGYVKRINIITVGDFWDSFNTEEKCHDYLFERRCPEGFVCPRCKERESHFQPERKLPRIPHIKPTKYFHNMSQHVII